jgi:hypothetical protein
MKDINLIKSRMYKDACEVVPKKNRRVAVIKSKTQDGIIIQFKRADISKDELSLPSFCETNVKDKLKVANISISNEAAAGLFFCLYDYLTRILPDYQETK